MWHLLGVGGGAAQGPTMGPVRIKAYNFLQIPSQSVLTEIFYGGKGLPGEGIFETYNLEYIL